MFKREGRFDGQLRGFKLRQKEEHFTAPKISLSSFFFFPRAADRLFFFPSLALSLSYREARERAYQIYEKINNNKSKSVARGRADALEPLERTRD